MKRPTYSPPRSELRIADLKGRPPGGRKIMNMRLPNRLANAIDEMAHKLNASKQSVVVALLNEGLEAARTKVRR